LGECLPDGWRQELDDEVRSYAALLADEKIQAGMTNEQARRNARIELGGIEQTKEQVREVRAGHLLESFWRDQRIALRALRKKPGFTIVVVLSLALGIGANAAIFSLIDAIVFRPMPVPHAGEVIAIDTAASKLTRYGGSSYLDYVDFCARAKTFKTLEISQQMSVGITPPWRLPPANPKMLQACSYRQISSPHSKFSHYSATAFYPKKGKPPKNIPSPSSAIRSGTAISRKIPTSPEKSSSSTVTASRSLALLRKSFTGIDLFYRPDIYLKEDIPDLLECFLVKHANELKKYTPELGREARKMLFATIGPGIFES
jgi:hypothetical protein